MVQRVLNLNHVVGYLYSLPIASCDGLWSEVQAKMSECGVAANKRAAIEVMPVGPPTGNLGSLLLWVRSMEATSTDENKAKLRTVHAVLRNRYVQMGVVVD